MIDNWQKFNDMSADKLFEEIKMLHNKLTKLPNNAGMRQQMMEVIQMAQTAYNEKLYMARFENNPEDDSGVFDIGEIESNTYTPNYNNNSYVNTIASTYVSKVKK